jgi:D-tagatose-1,6-bisphosphate aldolase subunit GatZ/KbaZ
MVSNPDHWKSYYQGDEAEKRFLRKFGLSDRCRYYWGVPAVTRAVDQLLANLRSVEIPLALLNQYMPRQSLRVQEGALPLDPDSLIRAQVDEVLARYAAAVS